MSEIEKMYENAGIKPYIYCSKPQLDCDARETGNCKKDCEYYSGKRLLTPFTAEKQIELIKWLGKNKQGLGIDYYGEWSVGVKFEWEFYKYSKENEKFTEALAGIINDLWQDLTEEEKQQVKGTLE